jgi:glutaredoxin
VFSKSYCPYCRAVKKIFAEEYPEAGSHSLPGVTLVTWTTLGVIQQLVF